MSNEINSAHIKGRAGKDADVRFTSTGKAIAKFSIATGGGKKKDGSAYPTEWHNIEAWDNETAAEVRKGATVEVKGRIKTDSWDDRTTGQKKYMTVIVASEVILEGAGDRDIRADMPRQSRQRTQAQARPVTEQDPISDDDLPPF
jgi:single-strand DNA-binding protein